jgi:hypothetical protein
MPYEEGHAHRWGSAAYEGSDGAEDDDEIELIPTGAEVSLKRVCAV